MSFKAAVNAVETDFVPALKNSSCLGIYTLNGWIADASEIEALFDITDRMRQALRESTNLQAGL